MLPEHGAVSKGLFTFRTKSFELRAWRGRGIPQRSGKRGLWKELSSRCEKIRNGVLRESGRSSIISPRDADVAQLVEHDLAKVGVAGSNPVVRSIVANRPVIIKSFDRPFHDGVDEMATWPSGKAEACKAFTPGSNPGVASIRSPCGADGLRIEKRYPCGRGSAGRARPCQGRGFEPRRPLHDRTSPSVRRRAFFMPRSERRRLEQL